MSRRWSRTLLWRLGLALMGVQILVAIGLGAFAWQRVRAFHYEHTLETLQAVAPLLARQYRPLFDAGADETLDAALRRDADLLGVRITVVRGDGAVVGDTHAPPASMDNHSNRPEIRAALDDPGGTGGSAIRFSATVGADMLYLARPLGAERDARAVVRVALPVRRIDADLTQLALFIGGGGIAAVVLTLLVIFLVSRRLGAQLGELAASASRFAEGDFAHRIDPPRLAELESLASALDDMARQLDGRIDDLQRQKAEQQAILQSMSSGVIALDPAHRILDLNRAAERMLGIDAPRARQRLLQEVVRQPELHRLVDRTLADDGTEESCEFTLSGMDPITVQAVSERLTGSDGRTEGILLVLNDVSQLRRFESLRTDFAANVSHELRTPITNIKGYVETLLDFGLDDRAEALRFLDIIRRNGDRLAAIVEDVMALSQLERPEAREMLDCAEQPIAPIAHSVAGQYEAAAGEKSMRLETDVEPELAATVHAQLIEQALANLVSNAIRYGPEGTRVVIAGRRTADGLVLEVTDEGPGIPAERLPRLFERFYRADKARSRELGGTGLGLAIVKHIALVHGGHVEVESTVGSGSTFRLILPEIV